MPSTSSDRRLRIGTSGWSYDGWSGPFYPDFLAKKGWLAWYSHIFSTTEINSSFYRTPSLEAVRNWRGTVPDDFVFAWKASKFISHWKRLGPTSKTSLKLMETRLAALGTRLGPVLFQLPERMHADRERLAKFLSYLSPKRRYAFEFRHASWYEEPILKLLSDEGMALCVSDHHQAPAPWEATADHVYVRLHGPTGRYHGHYRAAALKTLVKAITRWHREGRDVYVYFDNDQKSAAPQDAKSLIQMLPKRLRPPLTKNHTVSAAGN
jgi:uncharacterized protein YecE (DUF72 family)